MKLSYREVINKIEKINIAKEIVGTSSLGEPIYCFHVGKKGGKQILLEGSIHAREYISTLALLEELNHLISIEHTLDFGAYFIPLVNPDGVRLVLEGCNFLPLSHKKYLLKLNHQNPDFSLWKANIWGVDLNNNFNAMWGLGKFNLFSPAPASFVGNYPNSEPETNALLKFMASHSINGTLSVHTKGNLVYYGYDNLSLAELARDKFIATRLADYLNFKPEKTYASVGGFSDYVSEMYHCPALTIELGADNLSHPITNKFLPEILESFIGITSIFSKLI